MNAEDSTLAAAVRGMNVSEAASFWLVRRDSQLLSPAEQQAFKAWLAARPENREAFQKALGTLNAFGDHADAPQFRGIRAAALTSGPGRYGGLRVAAAGIAVLVGLSMLVLTASPALRGEVRAWVATDSEAAKAAHPDALGYATARTERSTITLSDGTVVSLNLDTALEVEFSKERRRVRIAHGQAFFAVATDARRPFSVEAAGHRIDALGTEFDVRLDSDRLEIVLLEGRVVVDRVPASIFDAIRSRSRPVKLMPGQRLVAADDTLVVTRTNAENDTSWRQGWIAFEGERLATAVATLNRYSNRRIAIADESVRALRVSGVFRIDQPDQFGALIQELLPVRVAHDEQGALLLLPREDAEPRSR